LNGLKYFSMFSGIGGFELGIQRSSTKNERQSQGSSSGDKEGQCSEQPNSSTEGFTCIGFSEIDKYAIQIYKKHFNHKEYGDVSKIKWNDVGDFELLVAGFPCQAFSIAGKRGGFDDTRGTLFFGIARAAQEKQPRLLLLENVKGLLSHDKGRTFGTILNTLDELGYDLQWQVLNSKNFGVPQNRERVFIIGHLRGTSRPQVFPIGENSKTCDVKNGNKLSKHLNTLRGNQAQYSNQNFVDYGMRIRRLTPTECERLQGFPDGWTEGVSDTQRYKCLGNAVTVNVIEAIMERLL